MLIKAYRTPPVRGEDRVHLAGSYLKIHKKPPFAPDPADSGQNLEGGPS
jgi:hypothetical protein